MEGKAFAMRRFALCALILAVVVCSAAVVCGQETEKADPGPGTDRAPSYQESGASQETEQAQPAVSTSMNGLAGLREAFIGGD